MLGHNLTFIYSFQFLDSSLDKLVSNLPQESFKYTSERFKRDHFDLMTKASVDPCDYMDSFDKFNKTELPTKEEFFSVLNNESITDEQYEHAQNVWKI